MATQPTPRDRWLALALLLAALGLAYLVLVHPWFTVPLRATEAEIDTLLERELRVRTQLEQAPQVAGRLQQARERLASQPGFLPEASAELASSALVQRLEQAVLAASPGNRSCAISTRSPLPPETVERFTRVAVQVRLRCGTPELASLLHALESGSPRLFVDNLNVLAQRYQLGPNDSGNGLDVGFELSGYLNPSVVVPSAEVAHAR